ncbi:MAG: hypothetical protein FJ319_05295 [SAR202 cluster bacterium]|nr:hypothetical protein [SAR202 cluster bacterium]
MTNERVLINPVDTFATNHSHGKSNRPMPKATAVPRREYREVSLSDARTRLPSLSSPGYVPDGYVLSRVSIGPSSAQVVMLTYTKPGSGTLQIQLNLPIKPQGVDIKNGYFEAVSFGRVANAFMVRGIWARGSSGPDLEWETGNHLQLIFERDGEVGVILAFPATEWPEDEILKVAASL